MWRPKKPALILPGDPEWSPPGLCSMMPHRAMMGASGLLIEYTVQSGSGANWTAGSNYSFDDTDDEITYGQDQTAYIDATGGAPFGDYLIYRQTIDGSGNHFSAIFDWADVGSINLSARDFDETPSHTPCWILFTDAGATTVYYNSTLKFTYATACTDNDTAWIEREADGTVKFYRNGGLVYTGDTALSGDVSIALSSGAATAVHADAVSWTYKA